MSFTGIPPCALTFFADLEQNNTKSWWADHKHTYDQHVRTPFLALLDSVDDRYQPWRIYRPHCDTRFAHDKSPYKTFLGAVTQLRTGNGHFIRLDKRGLLVGSGYPMMARDQLERFRNAIDDPAAGKDFATRVTTATETGTKITAGRHDRLRGAPRGYPRDHPRLAWLQAKGIEIQVHLGSPAWLDTAAATHHVTAAMSAGEQITEWLDTHVGPSALTPEEIWGRKRPIRN